MNGCKEGFLRFKISINSNCFSVIHYQNNLFVIQLKVKGSFLKGCLEKQMGKVLNMEFKKLVHCNKIKKLMGFTACLPLPVSPFNTLKRYQYSNYSQFLLKFMLIRDTVLKERIRGETDQS